ncbi:MAG: DUF429 domain-containing protein [Zestosphaera sp.]
MKHAIGLDLSAKPERCSGIAVVNTSRREVTDLSCLGSDEEILNSVRDLSESVIAIDAPLTAYPLMREVDRLMIKSGLRVLPPNFRWMRQLTLRGYSIMSELSKVGFTVIETHPRSVMKQLELKDVRELLKLLGIRLNGACKLNKHLEDALIAAAVAYCYLTNCVTSISAHDGTVYLITDRILRG